MATDQFDLKKFSEIVNLGSADPVTIVARLIPVVLGFVGIIFIVMILRVGFQFMLSGGKEENTAVARRTFVNALIGLTIVVTSYGIVQFLLRALSGATGSGEVPEVF